MESPQRVTSSVAFHVARDFKTPDPGMVMPVRILTERELEEQELREQLEYEQDSGLWPQILKPVTKTRTNLVFDSLKSVSSRYVLCRVVFKVTRKFHTPAARMEETINAALVRIALPTAIDLHCSDPTHADRH